MVISEGLIAKITDSNNEINFQLLEMNTKDKKMVFKNKNILGELVCDVWKSLLNYEETKGTSKRFSANQ